MTFKDQIQEGIPSVLPQPKEYDTTINHAPKRKEILSAEEKKLAIASKEKAEKKLGKKIATRIEPVQTFYPAEDEHQDFYQTNPGHYNRYVEGSGRKQKLKALWDK